MAQIQLTVCDVDKTELGKETQHYTINTPGGRSELDLCVDHAKPIEAILEQVYGGKVPHPNAPAKKTAAKKTTTPRRTRGAKVVSLEEIERMKAEQS
ncbi:DNA binding protein [Streptomyces phage Verse]|uniref:DNA binding protein n=2 Tax=Streptomyces phage Amela TaxID=1673877 RepID=A0A0K1YA77_9CAUD|nr:DNA binding protein [Streptomyces phage Amela]AKY03784.1 DNA binding protein [Streptomyces phage Amela]AKY03859.1 DNA binding protein [Streptomyces phage Verse]